MLNAASVASVVLALAAVLMMPCQGYQMGGSFPSLAAEDRSGLFRHSSSSVDLFQAAEDRLQPEENDSSAASDEASMLEFSAAHPSPLAKRRKGPTLSVVNPLEILRQRLMLDLATRRMHENQKQIVANAELLETLGKRASSSAFQP